MAAMREEDQYGNQEKEGSRDTVGVQRRRALDSAANARGTTLYWVAHLPQQALIDLSGF